MKIIRVTTFLDYGGIETKMVNISTWHDKNEWIFIAINKGGEAETKIRNNGKRVLCLNLPYKIPSFKAIAKLYSIFRKEKPDVVHTAGAEANFHGIIAAKLANIPVKIAEEIGIPSHTNTARYIFTNLFRLSDFVVGESALVVNFINNNYKVSEWKVRKIFNFMLERNVEYEPNKIEGKFRIVTIARLVKVKNIEAVLKLLPDLLEIYPNVIYSIVGEGPEGERLRQLTKELKINRHVEFVGFSANPFEYLTKSNLFLLNSFTEGFSNSLLEAMYSGIPSLSTRVGGAEDMIEDGVNGWLITPGDNNELLKKIKDILKLKPDVIINIGKSGQETVRKKFTLSNHMSDLMELYTI